MLRIVNTILLVFVGALIVLLYQLKYESRQLEERKHQLARDIEQERDKIAVLRAEWSLMSRPERIERLAKKHLGLQSAQTEQTVTKEWLKSLKSSSVRKKPTKQKKSTNSEPASSDR